MNKETQCVHSSTEEVLKKREFSILEPSFNSHEYVDVEDFEMEEETRPVDLEEIEQKICDLEGGQKALVFSSGIVAIGSVLVDLLEEGDHMIFQDEIYGGMHGFIDATLKGIGVTYTIIGNDPISVETALKPETKLVLLQTPTSPTFSIVDIEAICRIAKNKGCLTVVDNTFATPIFQPPIALGADVVIHSSAKYLGGHNDLKMGAVVLSSEVADRIQMNKLLKKGEVGPDFCHLLDRSLQTLAVRMNAQSNNAMKIAEFLDDHPDVVNVIYPGLVTHPGHSIGEVQMQGYGAMFSFELNSSVACPDAFLHNLKIITPTLSLGGVESTICESQRSSHAKHSFKHGYTEHLLRLSVGVENADDLIQDIEQAISLAKDS